jgi:putative restriction endonuclease
MALARVQRGEGRLIPYQEVHSKLGELLLEFGPPRQSYHPEYPFWRLQNDGGFWEVPEREAAIEARGNRPRAGDIPPSILTGVQATGGFTSAVFAALRRDPNLVNEIAGAILDEHFPSSMHESLLDAVGMPWVVMGRRRVARDPEFRAAMIRLYEHRCAMCGFDGRLGSSDLALEAAHIMWHALGGPDDPTNGLLLCSIHHRALDRGAMGITDDRRILVSQDLHGGTVVGDLLVGLGGTALATPIDPSATPAPQFIAWHRREVFRDPARPQT